jgi:hypothetical protein
MTAYNTKQFMTQKELEQFVKDNRRRTQMIDEETGLSAVEMIGEIANKAGVEWAVIGGFAMYLYGSPRFTKDVDVIASKTLSLESFGRLKQGGERYQIQVGRKTVPIDWITRRDDATKFFKAALSDAVELDGVPIITPEWLVILKHIAGRFKDQEDAVFLLRQKGLVNRKKIKENIVKVGGREAWVGFSSGLYRWFDLADGKITDGDENDSYRTL